MINVINSLITQCKFCGANLSYEHSDVNEIIGRNKDSGKIEHKILYITCPICKHMVVISKNKRGIKLWNF